MKLKITLKPHSVIDVITNSSTEIFCSIRSAQFINEIAEELSKILEREIEPILVDFNDEDIPNPISQIDFWMEYGDEADDIQADFRKLVEYVLTEKFGEGNFEVFIDSW